jgi:hypothetical protein
MAVLTWSCVLRVVQLAVNGSRNELIDRLTSHCLLELQCGMGSAVATCDASGKGPSSSPSSSSPSSPSSPSTPRGSFLTPVVCPCAAAGIPCHPRTCRCCSDGKCGNASGCDVYDGGAVSKHRSLTLSQVNAPFRAAAAAALSPRRSPHRRGMRSPLMHGRAPSSPRSPLAPRHESSSAADGMAALSLSAGVLGSCASNCSDDRRHCGGLREGAATAPSALLAVSP